MSGSWVICAALILLTAAAYWPVRDFGFVDYDDPGCVTQNPHVISGLSSDNVKWAFTACWVGHWVPIAWISYQVDASWFHLDPGAMHLENVGWHAASVVLVFLFLNASTGKRWRSAMVAAVFAVHPLHVESVAWVSERRDVISGPPLLGAVMAYVMYTRATGRASGLKWYLISLLLFVVSLLGKATGVTLPVVLLLVDLWPLGRLEFNGWVPRPIRSSWRVLLLEKLPFLIISMLVSWQAVRAQQSVGAAVSLAVQPLGARVSNALVCDVIYLGKFFLPIQLAAFYPLQRWSMATALGATAVLLAITGLVMWARRRAYTVFGWWWFLIILLPVSGIFQSGSQSMADRYMYLPMIGLTVAAVWSLADGLPRRWLDAGAAVTLVVLLVLSRHQLQYWRSSTALRGHAVELMNDGAELHVQLARLDLSNGDRVGAQREYLRAAELDPSDFAPEFDLGNLLLEQPAQAIAHYQRALVLKPHAAVIENNLGIAWIKAGRPDRAMQALRAAAADDADYADPHANLGLLLLDHGYRQEAANEFAAALRIDAGNRIARSGMQRLHGGG
jgi:Tfp pilus assembly protein PilF